VLRIVERVQHRTVRRLGLGRLGAREICNMMVYSRYKADTPSPRLA